MATNDQIILDEVLSQNRSALASNLSESEYFELFTAEQVLKDYDLSYLEIESGLVGAGGDGGIDSFYIFVNGELVQENPDYSNLRRDITLELVIIQSKTTKGFSESTVERFITVSDDIFDLTKQMNNFVTIYNANLLELIDRFRSVQRQLASKFPTLKISYYYCSQGVQPSESIERKVGMLDATVKRLFPSAIVKFNFVGAPELLQLARRQPQQSFKLTLTENPVSSSFQIGYICLVNITEYFRFIVDENQRLRKALFEANVRDYQGNTEVNADIQSSLKTDGAVEDFWWLNNGVTIVATKAVLSGKTLDIEDPQIVNGLQTSREIYNYLVGRLSTTVDKRNLLVRVVVADENDSRDRIIKATNSQTKVPDASLRATEKIHRDIEEYLRPRGLFYDRRKNYYKNEGRPRNQIIAIPYLAQAIMSIILQRPNDARARPSSLIKDTTDYKNVFNPAYPIQTFYVCVQTSRKCEEYLRVQGFLSSADRNNIRFYFAMYVVCYALRTALPTPEEVGKLNVDTLTDELLDESLDDVLLTYEGLGGDDQVAKGTKLVADLKKALAVQFSRRRQP